MHDLRPVDRAQSSGDQVHGRHTEQNQRADLEGYPVARRNLDDVAQALCLDLDVEDGEEHRDDGGHDAHGLALVEVRQQVRRRDVAELLAQRPDPRAEDVGDGTDDDGPCSRIPEPDAVGIEEPPRAEKGECGVVRGHDGEEEDDESGLPPGEEEVLDVDGELLARQCADADGDQQVNGDQCRSDDPGFHHTPRRAAQMSTAIMAR